MNDHCSFSLIVATKNRPKALGLLLDSLKTQISPPSYEVIIVDDASDEVDGMLAKRVDLWLTNPISLGPSYSRNVAALKARGDYFLFLDDDTELRPQSLKILHDHFMEDANLGALGGCGPRDKSNPQDVDYISIKNIRNGRNEKIFRRSTDPSDSDLIEGDHLESAFMAIPRHAFFSAGGFDPYWFYMGEDRDLCLALKKQGLTVKASWSARAIHDNFTSYGSNDWATRRNFRFKRIIEVSLKQKGLAPTLLHLVRERKKVFRYLSLKEVLIPFKDYSKLKERRKVNYLNADALLQYKMERLHNLKTREHPRNIVLFLNNRCNLSCEHCFIPDLNTKTFEAKPSDWLELLKTLENPFSLTLTGGEIFLSQELEKFSQDVLKYTKCKYLGLLTNGSFPQRTFELAQSLTRNFPEKKIKVQISLDGTEEVHNKIRKNKHSFKKAIETANLLKGIQNKKLSYIFLATLTKTNRENISEMITVLEKQDHPSKVTLIRGNTFSTFDVPEDYLKNDYEPQAQMLQLSPKEIEEFISEIENQFPNYFTGGQREKLLTMSQVLKKNKTNFNCHAGRDEVVFYSDGQVGFCEQTKPVGKIVDFKHDFEIIWNSVQATKWRENMKQCSCIHGCNISTSIRKKTTLEISL